MSILKNKLKSMIVDSTFIVSYLDPENFLITFHCFEPEDEQCAHVMAAFLSKTKVILRAG